MCYTKTNKLILTKMKKEKDFLMSNKAKIREEAKKLNPIDNLMFQKMAEETAFCEEILQVILSDPNLKVIDTTPQYVGTNLQGRSVILDARCILSSGKQINIEVQKADDDNHQKRVRYNGAILTTNITDPGTKFEQVPDVCIIFISKFDLFQSSRSLYHVDRIVRETGKKMENGFEELYVNAKGNDGSVLSELMEVFVKDDVYNSKFPITSDRKRRYKQTEEGQKEMSEIIEKIRNEGKVEGKLETLYSLVKQGLLSLTEGALQANMSEESFQNNMNKMFPIQ